MINTSYPGRKRQVEKHLISAPPFAIVANYFQLNLSLCKFVNEGQFIWNKVMQQIWQPLFIYMYINPNLQYANF